MKNKLTSGIFTIIVIICMLTLPACGQEYPSGAMTEDATLTLTWQGEEIVLDAVTLATLVTTELAYTTLAQDGTATEGLSVVFDLLKYLDGEGWELGSCRAWVLTDRQDRPVFIPTDQVSDSLYIGITQGAENLEYPISVIPEGPSAWQVWELARIDFRVEKVESLVEEAERAEAAARRQEAQEAVEGARHIALARGIAGREDISVMQLISDNLAELPEGPLRALTRDEEEIELSPEQAGALKYRDGKTVFQEQTILCLTFSRQALWLAGPADPPALFQACGMIAAEDYTFFAANGASVKLTAAEAEAAAIAEDDEGGWKLIYSSGRLDGLISVTAGQPIVEEAL